MTRTTDDYKVPSSFLLKDDDVCADRTSHCLSVRIEYVGKDQALKASRCGSIRSFTTGYRLCACNFYFNTILPSRQNQGSDRGGRRQKKLRPLSTKACTCSDGLDRLITLSKPLQDIKTSKFQSTCNPMDAPWCSPGLQAEVLDTKSPPRSIERRKENKF